MGDLKSFELTKVRTPAAICCTPQYSMRVCVRELYFIASRCHSHSFQKCYHHSIFGSVGWLSIWWWLRILRMCAAHILYMPTFYIMYDMYSCWTNEHVVHHPIMSDVVHMCGQKAKRASAATCIMYEWRYELHRQPTCIITVPLIVLY